jgi:acetate kinase
MREVQNAARHGNDEARLALRIYAHRVRQSIGAFAVTLGGIDALVFTAGVGEHDSVMRAAICDGLNCLGLKLDVGANDNCSPDADIATADSPGRILVIETREDVTMLDEVRCVLNGCRQENHH